MQNEDSKAELVGNHLVGLPLAKWKGGFKYPKEDGKAEIGR